MRGFPTVLQMKFRVTILMPVLIAAATLAGDQAPMAAPAQAATSEVDPVQHRADLVAQCPANPRLAPEQEDKLPIAVTHWGDTGPKVLIIHGGEQAISAIGGGPKNFSGQRQLGTRGWQLSIPDRPGFGASPSRGRDDQLADARWIAAMLSASGGTHLWGHSFGGAEALLAAARQPDSVRSLVLVEPDLWPMADAVPPAQVRPEIKAERDAREQALMAADSPAAYASGFITSFQPSKSGAKIWLMRQALELMPGLRKKIGCGALQAHEASGEEFRQAAEIVKAAGIPVLVVTGGWSPARDAVGELAAHELGGTHVIVPATNHIVMQSNPTDFNRVVTQFMQASDR